MNTNSALVIPAQSSATNAADLTLHDIKAPVDIPNPWLWLGWAIGILLLCAALFYWRRWLKEKIETTPARVIFPHERARKKLEQALHLISEPVPFTVVVSDTIRVYLEERFNFHAPERTTEEFLHELQNTELLTPDQKQSLGEFLSRCDLVKFARYEPTEAELHDLYDSAIRLVDETEPKFTEPTPHSQVGAPEETSLPSAGVRGFKNKNSKGKTYAVLGTCFQLTPVIWVFAYLIAIARLLKLVTHIKSNPSMALEDVMKPFNKMSSIYMDSFLLAFFGLALGVIGLVFLVIALVKFRYRAEWFFWFLMIYGSLLIATPFGIFFVVYCLVHRREFVSFQPLKMEVSFK